MQTAKIFTNGRSQAVRLPKDFRFSGNDVFIKKIGMLNLLIKEVSFIFISINPKFRWFFV